MCWTREQLQALKQVEAQQEAQAQEKERTKIYFCYADDLL